MRTCIGHARDSVVVGELGQAEDTLVRKLGRNRDLMAIVCELDQAGDTIVGELGRSGNAVVGELGCDGDFMAVVCELSCDREILTWVGGLGRDRDIMAVVWELGRDGDGAVVCELARAIVVELGQTIVCELGQTGDSFVGSGEPGRIDHTVVDYNVSLARSGVDHWCNNKGFEDEVTDNMEKEIFVEIESITG